MRLATCFTCIAFLSITLLAPLASAAPARTSDVDADTAARRTTPAGTTPAGTTQLFVYDDEQLDGDSLHPDHERVDFRPPGKHPSLIKVRSHFIPQLLQMAQDV